ncbi:MAG TPA: 3-ketoacyl-ACP reductase [Lacipirellulaceae bacterium]|nr:3-ketoacyl-ACP reductase [Lacipirellulaceae bacterium]
MSKPDTTRTAFVTGGSRGIGLGIARALAAEGWQLAINGMRPEADVREVLHALRQSAPAIYCRGDVSQPADRAECLARIRAEFGRLHLLVNNAGIAPPSRDDILQATEASFDKVFDVNLKGPYFLTQAAARQMVADREADPEFDACIINISSISAEVASVNRGDYCMARAGTSMATKLWAVRLAEFGIRVYEIRPGIIATDMTAGVKEKYDALIAGGLTLERRWGAPEDIGRAAAALARNDFPYATGQVVTIAGGMTLGRL